ncbi:MAG: hypothetical protein ABIQ40_17665 [Bacteroidia bacterium]
MSMIFARSSPTKIGSSFSSTLISPSFSIAALEVTLQIDRGYKQSVEYLKSSFKNIINDHLKTKMTFH